MRGDSMNKGYKGYRGVCLKSRAYLDLYLEMERNGYYVTTQNSEKLEIMQVGRQLGYLSIEDIIWMDSDAVSAIAAENRLIKRRKDRK